MFLSVSENEINVSGEGYICRANAEEREDRECKALVLIKLIIF